MRTKRLFLFVIACFFTVYLNAQIPIIVCDKSSHNFGTILEENGPVTHVFTIKNMGKSPLVMDYCSASCGCTSPEWTKQPILPGKSGKVKIVFDPKDSDGVFVKTIWIYSNAAKKPTTLVIRGKVIGKVKNNNKR